MTAKSKFPTAMEMPSIENLFTTEDERQAKAQERIQMLPLTELHPFKGHPFAVRDDAEMDKMIESVQEHGIMTPVIVRPGEDGGYEVVSGHRRSHAAKRAGLEEVPAIVREMDDDAAIILMVDANVQRERILPMEKARAFRMKLDALKRQGKRTDLTSGQVGPKLTGARSNKEVAEQAGESKTQVQRYIRLNSLIPPLQTMVDDNVLKFNPAVEISYLTPAQQQEFYDYMDEEACTPTLSQAQKLKAASKNDLLTAEEWVEKLESIMTRKDSTIAPPGTQLHLNMERLAAYFPKEYSKAKIEQEVMRILEGYFKQLEQNQSQELER